ncbi:hypothetical protein [Aeromonas veronii]|nr:hypothetical protein [Aeromonas veronii]
MEREDAAGVLLGVGAAVYQGTDLIRVAPVEVRPFPLAVRA